MILSKHCWRSILHYNHTDNAQEITNVIAIAPTCLQKADWFCKYSRRYALIGNVHMSPYPRTTVLISPGYADNTLICT